LAGDRSFGAEENLLARDHAQQITTNDAAFLVIPAEAGIQKNGRDTGIRRYDGWAFEVLPSPLARRLTRNPMSTSDFLTEPSPFFQCFVLPRCAEGGNRGEF
jgi:hypothetical protein